MGWTKKELLDWFFQVRPQFSQNPHMPDSSPSLSTPALGFQIVSLSYLKFPGQSLDWFLPEHDHRVRHRRPNPFFLVTHYDCIVEHVCEQSHQSKKNADFTAWKFIAWVMQYLENLCQLHKSVNCFLVSVSLMDIIVMAMKRPRRVIEINEIM